MRQHDEEDRQQEEGEEQLQEGGHLGALLALPDGDSTSAGEGVEGAEDGGDVKDATSGQDFEDFLGRQEEGSGGKGEEELEEEQQQAGAWPRPASPTGDCPGPGTLPQAGHGTVLLDTHTHLWNWQVVSQTFQHST